MKWDEIWRVETGSELKRSQAFSFRHSTEAAYSGERLSQLDIKLSEVAVTYINFMWEHDGLNFLYEMPP